MRHVHARCEDSSLSHLHPTSLQSCPYLLAFRQLADVRVTAATLFLLEEPSVQPVEVIWLTGDVTFWNSSNTTTFPSIGFSGDGTPALLGQDRFSINGLA